MPSVLYLRISLLMLVIVAPLKGKSQQSAFHQRIDALYERQDLLLRPGALRDSLQKGKEVYLLDSRTLEEFRVSHLPGAHRVDFEGFQAGNVDTISTDAMVVVYCTVGWRSEQIAARLNQAGYQRVYNLYGSIIEWANLGYPLIKPDGQSTQKVHTYSRSWSAYLTQGKPVYDWWKFW